VTDTGMYEEGSEGVEPDLGPMSDISHVHGWLTAGPSPSEPRQRSAGHGGRILREGYRSVMGAWSNRYGTVTDPIRIRYGPRRI